MRPLSMLEESKPLKIGDTFIEMPFSVRTPMVICYMTGRLERIKEPFTVPRSFPMNQSYSSNTFFSPYSFY
jgi:hypothetical protein